MKLLLLATLLCVLTFVCAQGAGQTPFGRLARQLARRQRSLVRDFEKERRTRRYHRKSRRQMRRLYSRLERKVELERFRRPRRISRFAPRVNIIAPRPVFVVRRRSPPRRRRAPRFARAPRFIPRRRRAPRFVRAPRRRRAPAPRIIIRERRVPRNNGKDDTESAIRHINGLLGYISEKRPKVNVRVHTKKPIINVHRVKENTQKEIKETSVVIDRMIQAALPKMPTTPARTFTPTQKVDKTRYYKFLEKVKAKSDVNTHYDDFNRRLGKYQKFLTTLQEEKKKRRN